MFPIRRQPCHWPLNPPWLASEAYQKLRDGASPDKNPSQFSVFDVIFVGHVVRLGPADYELLHRRLTVAIPLVLNAQPVKRILEMVESAVALDRTPKLCSGLPQRAGRALRTWASGEAVELLDGGCRHSRQCGETAGAGQAQAQRGEIL